MKKLMVPKLQTPSKQSPEQAENTPDAAQIGILKIVIIGYFEKPCRTITWCLSPPQRPGTSCKLLRMRKTAVSRQSNWPVDDLARLEKMLQHGNLLITAWDGTSLIGVARALTDFSYCCYLSDLAV